MAGSLNKVTLIGNLGKDPEARSFAGGGRVVNFSVATSESWKDRNSGEQREKTEWHKVAIFSEPLGKIAEQYLRKGSKVYLEGKLQTRKWQDQSGKDQYSTEVVLQGFDAKMLMLSEKNTQRGGGDDYGGYDRGGGYEDRDSGGGTVSSKSQRDAFASDLDDDVPF